MRTGLKFARFARDRFPVRRLFVGMEWGVCSCAAQDQEAAFG